MNPLSNLARLARDAHHDASAGPAVTNERLLHTASEPGSWLLYHGGMTPPYSALTQITPASLSVKTVKLQWIWAANRNRGGASEKFEATPARWPHGRWMLHQLPRLTMWLRWIR